MIIRLIKEAKHQPGVRKAGSYRAWIAQTLDIQNPGATPDWTLAGTPVIAEINAGNWQARCPDCDNYMIIEASEPFVCVECQNILNNGHARPVIWPENRAAIEGVLLARPFPRNRNWTHTETIDQLKAENRAHGYPETQES